MHLCYINYTHIQFLKIWILCLNLFFTWSSWDLLKGRFTWCLFLCHRSQIWRQCCQSLGLSDPNNVIFIPWSSDLTRDHQKIVFYHLEHNFTGGPPPKHDWASFQFQLGGFVEKTWNSVWRPLKTCHSPDCHQKHVGHSTRALTGLLKARSSSRRVIV